MTKLLTWMRLLDSDGNGKITFNEDIIPIIYTVYIGFMLFWERHEGQQFSDWIFTVISAGSLGTHAIVALLKAYQIKHEKS